MICSIGPTNEPYNPQLLNSQSNTLYRQVTSQRPVNCI